MTLDVVKVKSYDTTFDDEKDKAGPSVYDVQLLE